MSTSNGQPPTLPGCSVLPPMESAGESTARGPGKARKASKASKASKAKGKTGERFAVLNAFVDFSLARLNRAEIVVWFLLYRDTKDGTAQTAVSDLARRAGCNRRTVFRALRRLEKLGFLKVVHRGGFGRGPSKYRVLALSRDG